MCINNTYLTAVCGEGVTLGEGVPWAWCMVLAPVIRVFKLLSRALRAQCRRDTAFISSECYDFTNVGYI